MKPTFAPAQPGCWSVAPLWPQRMQRALPQHVARYVAPPSDDGDRTRQRRVVLAKLAVQPEPRRRAVQVAERGGCAREFHGADWTPGRRI